MCTIYSGDRLVSLEELGTDYKEVNAAGGLVQDSHGRYLMIRRNDKWDLPKGHQEPGEEIKDTALREVWEETGLKDLVLKDLICVTQHCYRRDGVWVLKHTWWYNMLCEGVQETVPQTEENITQAVFMDKEAVAEALKDTYPSIREVFAGLL